LEGLTKEISGDVADSALKILRDLIGSAGFGANISALGNNLGGGFQDLRRLNIAGALSKGIAAGGSGIGTVLGLAAGITDTASLLAEGLENKIRKGVKGEAGFQGEEAGEEEEGEEAFALRKKKSTPSTGFWAATKKVGSGLKAGGLGVLTGISGVVMDPLRGAQKEGLSGFGMGLATGLAGVVLKPVAGVTKGVSKIVTGVGMGVGGVVGGVSKNVAKVGQLIGGGGGEGSELDEHVPPPRARAPRPLYAPPPPQFIITTSAASRQQQQYQSSNGLEMNHNNPSSTTTAAAAAAAPPSQHYLARAYNPIEAQIMSKVADLAMNRRSLRSLLTEPLVLAQADVPAGHAIVITTEHFLALSIQQGGGGWTVRAHFQLRELKELRTGEDGPTSLSLALEGGGGRHLLHFSSAERALKVKAELQARL